MKLYKDKTPSHQLWSRVLEKLSHSAEQVISCCVWNLKVPQEPTTGPYPYMNAVHNFPPTFCKMHSKIIPSTQRSSEWSLHSIASSKGNS